MKYLRTDYYCEFWKAIGFIALSQVGSLVVSFLLGGLAHSSYGEYNTALFVGSYFILSPINFLICLPMILKHMITASTIIFKTTIVKEEV